MHFNELTLAVPDLAAARDFYTGLLDFPSSTTSAGAALQAGRSRLNLIPADAGTRPTYHIAFSVPLARFDAARRRVSAALPLIGFNGDDVIIHEGWDAVAFYFLDPAGNVLECIARRHEPADDPAAPPAPAIMAICEVGLVVADVPASVKLLKEQIGVAPFRGSYAEQFAAVGNEAGLLILAQQGRVWWPDTGVTAVSAPLELRLRNDAGTIWQIRNPPIEIVAEA